MIVVADTTPLRYLILIGHVDLLPRIYGDVVISEAVSAELTHENAPSVVRNFVSDRPEWLRIERLAKPLESVLLAYLDIRESESIQLAEQLNASVLLIDERKGRIVAKERGLTIIGTLGILLQAEAEGWIELDVAVRKLDEADFRLSNKLIDRRFPKD